MKYTIKIFIIILVLSCISFSQIYAQDTESTRNPWQMTQQQYELYENTSVSQLNTASGAHPNYGALSLPDVSYITNQPDNGPQPTQAQFRFLAAPSHYLKDDPVVFPNQPGASHLHMFFGNTRTDANSEVGTGSPNDLMIRGASTVQGGKGANPSAYWMPALVDGPLNGCDDQRKIILPDAITVYYKTRRPGESQLIPEGLEVIGGNLPQSPGGMVHGMTIQNSSGGSFREGARWGFYDPAQGLLVQGQPTIPQSNPGGYKWLRAVIGFPQCFAAESNGGFVLSSPNHLSHQLMLEDAQGWSRDDQSCPDSHPNRIPKIEILVDFRWPDDNDVSGWRLSSDMNAATAAQVPNPGGSLHGDILFAWNPMVQQAWKDECHDPNDPRNCSIGQTGTQWILDRITNTATINNMAYTGQTDYLSDPYDTCISCPAVGTPCNDNDPNTINDIEDGNCGCVGTCLPAGTSCDDGNLNTQNDVLDANCNCAGTPLPISNCDFITNGDFSNDTTDWSSWSCDVDAGSGACRITNIQQGVNPWNAALSYTTYNFETINLTATLQTYTFTFTMNEVTDSNAFLEFFFGESDVNLFLGEVSLVETACVGLRELSNEMITNYTIFPNPVSDILTVKFDLSDEYNSGTVRLFDLNGKIVLEEQKEMFITNQFQMNIHTIPAGVYMLRVDVGGYFLTHKLVKY